MTLRKSIFVISATLLALSSCSTTKILREGEYLLTKNSITADDVTYPTAELGSYLVQKPSSTGILGWDPLVAVYNLPGDSQSGLANLVRRLGKAPVVYDSLAVMETVANLENHLTYTGYYGSTVTSQVEKGRNKKARVRYIIHLGRRYPISSIQMEVPGYGTFAEDFFRDTVNMTVRPGDFLSEKALEAETARGARYMRDNGYYGFSKSFYKFEADTLKEPGKAELKMSILDYPRSSAPSNAAQHRKYRIGEVTMTLPGRIKMRPGVLEHLNTLRPGDLYNETEVNTTYGRLSSLPVFNSVNLDIKPVSADTVNCDIRLSNTTGIQNIKVNFESSLNSTGLVGFSPQLTYSHQNAFRGGEVLTFGFKGNFQIKPGTSVRSIEMTTSLGIRFPGALGIPSSVFTGTNLPHTDSNLALGYNDRPEYNRFLGTLSLGYVGSISKHWFFQFYPLQFKVVRLSRFSDEFLDMMTRDRFLMSSHSDHFDLGVGGILYYTTDASAVPKQSYSFYRLSFDTAGNLLSLFNPLLTPDVTKGYTILGIPYSQYFKWEMQVGSTYFFGQDDRYSFAFRLLAGAGHPYGNTAYMPFEQQFYSGGASSMRGWQARTLGPGYSSMNDYFIIPSQSGDVKLEADLEFRFPLVWKLEGAIFAEAGNVWNHRDQYRAEEEQFIFSNLPGSIAADWGIGLRVNLDFILLRLDMGFKLHEPSAGAGERWREPDKWLTDGGYAVHFGVGYPF